jgi:hypothetical protein
MTFQMNASDMDPKWIEDMWAKFPCMKIVDQNGVENGNYRTGPVRGSFMQHVLTRAPIKQTANGQIGGKFSATALFPPAADISILKQGATETALAKWPNAGQVGGPTLHTPFRRQDEKLNLEGYTPGGIFITATADQRAPYAVNAQGAPIVDPALITSGAWYLFVLRPFTFDATMKKGVSYGLQGIMKIADDRNLGGGSSDPRADFAGVAIDTSAQAAAVNPAGLF